MIERFNFEKKKKNNFEQFKAEIESLYKKLGIFLDPKLFENVYDKNEIKKMFLILKN